MINQAGGFSHFLILPIVAILAELSMLALVVKTNRMRRVAQVDPEDLLAL